MKALFEIYAFQQIFFNAIPYCGIKMAVKL